MLLSATNIFGANDKYGVSPAQFVRNNKTSYWLFGEWYRNSSDSIMINFPISHSSAWIGTFYQYWTEPELSPSGVLDVFPGIYAEITTPFCYYDRPTQSADVRYYKVNTSLEIPDSIFIDAPTGLLAKNLITNQNEATLGLPVMRIRSGAFSLDKMSAYLPDTLLWEVRQGKAQYFTDFKKVVLPPSLITICSYAFYNNTHLEEINLDNVTRIESYAFGGCENLKTVYLKNLMYVGDHAFSGARLDSLTIINTIPSYETSCFNNVYAEHYLIDKTTPANSPMTIFSVNTRYLTLGNGISSIPNNAFDSSDNLETISFGSSIQSVGSRAFLNAPNLNTIWIFAKRPPAVSQANTDDAPFANCDKQKCTLYVPYGTLSAYKHADVWKEFFIKQMGSSVDEIEEEETMVITTDYYNIWGMRIKEPSPSEFLIRVDHLSDGTIMTQKIMNKTR